MQPSVVRLNKKPPPVGTDVWILGPQWVGLFSWGLVSVTLLGEVWHWGQALRFQSHARLALSASFLWLEVRALSSSCCHSCCLCSHRDGGGLLPPDLWAPVDPFLVWLPLSFHSNRKAAEMPCSQLRTDNTGNFCWVKCLNVVPMSLRSVKLLELNCSDYGW